MLKKIIILIALLFSSLSYSQNSNSKTGNIVYLDVGLIFTGTFGALGTGINYERILGENASIKVGINISVFGAGSGGDAVGGSGIGIPVTLNLMTNGINKFETNIGGGLNFPQGSKKARFFPALGLGYRHQPEDNGLFYKAGVNFPANLYLSLGGLGYKFK